MGTVGGFENFRQVASERFGFLVKVGCRWFLGRFGVNFESCAYCCGGFVRPSKVYGRVEAVLGPGIAFGQNRGRQVGGGGLFGGSN